MLPVPAQRNGDRAAGRRGVAVGAEDHNGVMGERAAGRGYPPGSGICGICGICGTVGGGVTVSVTVLVLVLVLMDVVGSVVVVAVVVGGVVVVSVVVDGGEVVSVTVCVGAMTGADVVGVVVVVFVSDDESDVRLTTNQTINASMSATSAPNATRAAGLRYQGIGGSGGWPGCWP